MPRVTRPKESTKQAHGKRNTRDSNLKEKTQKSAGPKRSPLATYQRLVLEAVTRFEREEAPWVNVAQIHKYVSQAIVLEKITSRGSSALKLTKNALKDCVERKFLKVKKESYALTSQHREKAPAVKTPAGRPIQAVPPGPHVISTGRISHETIV
jgi:hypothetical protein